MKITINAGHCVGIDSGATGFGLQEAQVALNISNMLKPILESVGFEVILIQSDSLAEVCNVANNANSDLFVSIHCNAYNGIAKGTECLHYPGSSKSIQLSQCIQNQLISTFNTVDRGLKERPGLYVLKHTDMPATLVETAFIDEASDNALLRDRQEDFAKAIARGITDYVSAVYGTKVEISPKAEQIVQPEATTAKDANTGHRPITVEDIAYYVSKMLIETGVEGDFDAVTKSSKSDYPSIGCSQWLYDRADKILSQIEGGSQFVGKTYSSIVNEGKLDELKSILKSKQGQEVQLTQLKEDCLNYVNDLRQIWWLDDTRCLIYAATWATTSVSTVHKFIEWQRGHINIRSLLALANEFASQYRSYFGVDEKYQLGYSNRAWRMYYAVAEIDLTSEFGIPEYGKGEFGR